VLAVHPYVCLFFATLRSEKVPAVSLQETHVEKVLTLEHAKLTAHLSWNLATRRAACEGVRQLLMHEIHARTCVLIL
jgi:hypothetical protein